MRRILAAAGLMLALAGQAYGANDWLNFATVSMTDPNTAKLTDRSICYSDGRDIACDNTGQYISTGGLINAGALQTSGYVSAGTIHTSGTVKVSNTVYATAFVGDGSLLSGVVASSGDRIVSGTTSMLAISNTGFILKLQSSSYLRAFASGAMYLDKGSDLQIRSSGGTPQVVVDSSGRLGVGTITPTATLQVSGSMIVSTSGQTTTPTLYVGTNGTVGIGTTNNGSNNLLVNQQGAAPAIYVSQSSGGAGIALGRMSAVNDSKIEFDTAGSVRWLFGQIGSSVNGTDDLFLKHSSLPGALVTFSSGGNVGIGNILNPVTALEVSGTVSATNFVGDGSGLTGLVGASADRIVSGTTSTMYEPRSSKSSGSIPLNSGNTSTSACGLAPCSSTWSSTTSSTPPNGAAFRRSASSRA